EVRVTEFMIEGRIADASDERDIELAAVGGTIVMNRAQGSSQFGSERVIRHPRQGRSQMKFGFGESRARGASRDVAERRDPLLHDRSRGRGVAGGQHSR